MSPSQRVAIIYKRIFLLYLHIIHREIDQIILETEATKLVFGVSTFVDDFPKYGGLGGIGLVAT